MAAAFFDNLLFGVGPPPVEGFGNSLMTVKVEQQVRSQASRDRAGAGATVATVRAAPGSNQIPSQRFSLNTNRERLRQIAKRLGAQLALKQRTQVQTKRRNKKRSKLNYATRKVWRKNILYKRNF